MSLDFRDSDGADFPVNCFRSWLFLAVRGWNVTVPHTSLSKDLNETRFTFMSSFMRQKYSEESEEVQNNVRISVAEVRFSPVLCHFC